MIPVALSHHGVEGIADAMPVMQAAFDPEYGEAWNDAQCRGVLTLPGATLIMARAQVTPDVPLGFALTRAIAGEAELMLLGVLPAHRGRGIGRRLIDEVRRVAGAGGATVLFLEVRADNSALALYSRIGFQEVGRRCGYYRGRSGKLRDALTLRVDLAMK